MNTPQKPTPEPPPRISQMRKATENLKSPAQEKTEKMGTESATIAKMFKLTGNDVLGKLRHVFRKSDLVCPFTNPDPDLLTEFHDMYPLIEIDDFFTQEIEKLAERSDVVTLTRIVNYLHHVNSQADSYIDAWESASLDLIFPDDISPEEVTDQVPAFSCILNVLYAEAYGLNAEYALVDLILQGRAEFNDVVSQLSAQPSISLIESLAYGLDESYLSNTKPDLESFDRVYSTVPARYWGILKKSIFEARQIRTIVGTDISYAMNRGRYPQISQTTLERLSPQTRELWSSMGRAIEGELQSKGIVTSGRAIKAEEAILIEPLEFPK
jgi:hypothetical protein